MDWARILVPLSGGESDRRAVAAAVAVAEPFGAEAAFAHAPPDVADLLPWMGDGFVGGAQASAVESIRQASAEGARAARAATEASGYPRASFVSLASPVARALAIESRLSDVVLFDDSVAKGRGPLADAFQQIVAAEQRPTIIARDGLKVGGVAALAWDGGKEASRAMRTALPLLERAERVVAFTARVGAARQCDPERLRVFLEARGVGCEIRCLDEGDAPSLILRAAREARADILVCGAFGHARLQEFIFGGATRGFLQADGPSLFLSH